MPLSMTSLAIDSAATSMYSTMQLTRQNRFTKSFSGSYKMTNSSRVRKLDRVRSRCHGCEVESSESTETCSPDEARREQQMANDSTRSSTMSDVFVVLFTFLVHFWLVIRKSDRVRVWPARLVRTTLKYFTAPTSNFRLIRAVCFLSRV